jgi:hypothetical protein|tara:strand:- start:1303 stop:1827 length:525 start_codon:yes stop_codon:yes gene_type:complete
LDINKYILILSLIIATALSNILLSNIPNFSPVASVALFSGFYLSNKKLALLIPVACMLISDYFIGFHSLMWAVYLSFAFTVVMGIKMKTSSSKKVIINSVLSSLIFFFITNSAVWLTGNFYSSDLSGLGLCLTMGIPFFKYTLLSSIVFSTILFGGFQILNQLINKYLTFSKKS